MESKRQATAEKWSQMVSQWEASGKNASQWCRENNVLYESFIMWRKRLKRSSSSEQNQHPFFIELTDNISKTGVELRLQGFNIALSKDFDPATLLRVLKILDQRRC